MEINLLQFLDMFAIILIDEKYAFAQLEKVL